MITSKVFDLTLPAPLEETIKDLLGLINRRTMRQTTAVDANVTFLKDGSATVLEAGSIRKVGLVIDVAPAAGESYSIVLQKSEDGGATYAAICPAIVIDSTNLPGVVEEVKGPELASILGITDSEVASGDFLRAAIDYTAGAGAAPASGLTIFIDIAPHK